MKRVTFETALRLDELGFAAPYSEYCEVRDAYALNEFSFLESSGNKEITVSRGDFIKDFLKSTFDSSDDRCVPQNMISAPTLDEARDFLRECYGVYLSVLPYWDAWGSDAYEKTHFMLHGYSLESVKQGKCFDGSFTADCSHYDDYEVALEDLINLAIDKINCGEA